MSGYFTELERELVRAERRAPRTRPRRRGAALLAAALIVVAGVPAAAAIRDGFRPHRDVDGVLRLTPRRVIAAGKTSDGRAWQLLGSQSSAGFCIAITLSGGEPNELAPGMGETCNRAKPGSLTLDGIYGSELHGLVSGMTPDAAYRVTVHAGAITRRVRTVDDRMGEKGRFYVIELPTRLIRRHMRAFALDRDGKVIRTTSSG
jgi:hypothetical protein